jgi:hypothetical protein
MDSPDNHPEQPAATGSFESADNSLRKTTGIASLNGTALTHPAVTLSRSSWL